MLTNIAVFPQKKWGIKQSSNALKTKRCTLQHDFQTYLPCFMQILERGPSGHTSERIDYILIRLYCSRNYRVNSGCVEHHYAPFKDLSAANDPESNRKFGAMTGNRKTPTIEIKKDDLTTNDSGDAEFESDTKASSGRPHVPEASKLDQQNKETQRGYDEKTSGCQTRDPAWQRALGGTCLLEAG